MTREELDELEKLADAATPAPWVVKSTDPWVIVAEQHSTNNEADAAFIVAARAAVPKLIARVRELEKERDEYKSVYKVAKAETQILEREVINWSITAAEAESRGDKLKAENERLTKRADNLREAVGVQQAVCRCGLADRAAKTLAADDESNRAGIQAATVVAEQDKLRDALEQAMREFNRIATGAVAPVLAAVAAGNIRALLYPEGEKSAASKKGGGE